MLILSFGAAMSIPVVDLSESSVKGDDIAVLREIHDAFTTVGFASVTGHSIPRDTVDGVFCEAKRFFSLPDEAKSKYCRTASSVNNGYVPLQQERIDPSKPGDLKECFNVTSLRDCRYPDQEVPTMQPAVVDFFRACSRLALTLLELMGHALKIHTGYPTDPLLFVKAHQMMESGSDNFTTLRLLHYPPLPPDCEIQPGQLRCGEHVDYGSITLLFQDSIGGLQVKQASGDYIDVPYRQDAVLVNLGALMQRWTNDTYKATPHRVLLPVEETAKKSVRQSLAFFCHPDNHVLVECVDGSSTYPPVLARDDCLNRLNRTYNY